MNTVQDSARFRGHLARRWAEWQDAGLERRPSVFGSGQGAVAEIDGEKRLLFASSNYLGLSDHPALREAARGALDRFGTGSGGSRLTTGTGAVHRELEHEVADWLDFPECVWLPTGYQTNLAVLSVLADSREEQVTVFSDEKNHASIIDGIRFAKSSGARLSVYPHRDVRHLAELLRTRETSLAVVVTDGLFSMDGTVAPVRELREVCDRYGALLVVDDAHGIGTLGEGVSGRGCCSDAGVRPDVLVGTASKALGTEGGFLCCDRILADLIRNRARSYVFSTAASPVTAAASLASVRLVRGGEAGVGKLHRNAAYLRTSLGERGVTAGGVTEGPIVPVAVGDERLALAVQERLREAAIHVPAIRWPTVRKGHAILRVTVTAQHTLPQFDRLVDVLSRSLRDLAVRPAQGSVHL